MSVYYRVDMRPLEPYTFGTEQGSKYDGVDGTGKESYIIASGNVPEQTTVLGTLRYIVLQKEGLLKSDFSYDQGEQKRMKEAVGEKSFSFQASKEQDFGKIKGLSPLFLIGKTDAKAVEFYIKTPFHYLRNGEKYVPLKLGDESLETSFGKIRLPETDPGHGPVYEAKKGHGSGYICLSNKEAAPDDLFQKRLLTGNRTDNQNGDRNESFFKRETIILKKGFEFSVYAEAEERCFPEQTIAFMGRKRSAFRFQFTRVSQEEADIESKVKKAFEKDEERWYYALSDLYPDETPKLEKFSIIESKGIRNIETHAEKKRYVEKRGKSKFQFHLIESGSVFYEQMDLKLDNTNIKKIGFNRIVQLGGN